MSRVLRRWISAFLAGVLLFASWATASYACARVDGGAQAVAAATTMAAMPDCDGSMAMDDDDALRCQAHCTADARAAGSGTVAFDLPPLLPVSSAIVAVVDAGAVREAAAAPWPAADGPPRGSPPLYLLLQILRN